MSNQLSFPLPSDQAPDWPESDVEVLDLVQQRAQLQLAEAAYLAARFQDAIEVAGALCARLDSLSGAPVSGGQPGERFAVQGMARTIIGLARAQSEAATGQETSGEDRRDFERALADYSAAGASARSAKYLQYVGIAEQMTGRNEEALATLGHAIEIGEAIPDARRMRARALRALDRPEEALEAARELVRSTPDDWRAATMLAELTEQLRAPADAAEMYEAAAKAARRAGRHVKTIELLTRALELDRGNDRRRARLAALHLSSGDAEGALRVLEPVGNLPDASPELLLQLSDALLATGHYAEALAQTRRVLGSGGDDIAPLRRLASGLLGLGDADGANAAAEELLAMAPNDPFAHAVKGLARLHMEDFAEAAAQLRIALDLAGDHLDLFRSLVRSLATVEDSESAIEALDAPGLRHLGVRRVHGNLLLTHDRFDEAVDEFEGLSEILPQDASLRVRLAGALLGAGATDRGVQVLAAVSDGERRTDEPGDRDRGQQVLLLRGQAYRSLGDLTAAEQVFRRARQEWPASRRVVWALVETLLDRATVLGDADDRAHVLAEAASLLTAEGAGRTSPHGVVLHARTEHGLGRGDAALALLREGRTAFPGDVEIMTWFGLVAHDVGLHKDALDALRTAQAERPGDPWICQELGRVAMETGHFEEARQFLVEAHSLAPHDMRTVTLLSTLLREDGSLRDAEMLLRRALQVHANDARLWAELADCLLRQGRTEDAEESLERVQELSPTDDTTLAVQGHVLLRLGRLIEAEAVLSEAVRTSASASAHADLGEVYWLRGHPESALPELDQALRLPGPLGRVRTVRAAVRAALGGADEARADLIEALEHDPMSLEALSQLRQLADTPEQMLDAQQRLDAAIQRSPEDPGLLRERAEILQRRGHWRAATDILDSLLRARPGDVDTLVALGRLMLQEGRLRQAQGLFRQALNRGCPTAALELAKATARNGDYSTALRLVQEYLTVNGEDPLTLNLRARLMCELGNWRTAVEDATRAGQAPRAYARVAQTLGWALQNTEEPRELVLAAFERALEIDRTSFWSRKGRANALYELEERAAADREYERVLQWASRNGEASGANASLAGWCLFRQGRMDEARRVYLRAVADNPRLAARTMDLGLVTLAGREADRAESYYVRALSTLKNRGWPHPRGVIAVASRDLDLMLRERPELLRPAAPIQSKLREAFEQATEQLSSNDQETHDPLVAVHSQA